MLTYHRIAEPSANPFYDPVISASPRSFRAQVEWLRDHTRILTLGEVDNRIHAGGSWNEPAALLTFDDGYRDNFDAAAPILKELDVPATFFIPTEFLESPGIRWWDHVAYVIKRAPNCRLELKQGPHTGSPPLVLELDRVSRDAAIMEIILRHPGRHGPRSALVP